MKETGEKMNTFPQRMMDLSGAIASILIITTIMYFFKTIPSTVSVAMGFFVSLPIVYSFIFGLILNKPNFSTLRHYGFLFYLLVAFGIYILVLKPESIVIGVRYALHFVLGFILATTGYFFYAVSYKISLKWTDQYRWRALAGFGTSLIITFIVAFVLKHFKIFGLV